jgi:hypothetical protein
VFDEKVFLINWTVNRGLMLDIVDSNGLPPMISWSLMFHNVPVNFGVWRNDALSALACSLGIGVEARTDSCLRGSPPNQCHHSDGFGIALYAWVA